MTPSLNITAAPERRRGHAKAGSAAVRRAKRRRGPAPGARGRLDRYVDSRGCLREVLTRDGAEGSVLVIDRDARTRGDRRLLAHLGADEPAGNAALVCRLYIERARRESCRCRPLAENDASIAPIAQATADESSPNADAEQTDKHGRIYRLQAVRTGMSIPELRWCRHGNEPVTGDGAQLVSVREVVAQLESYEPVRSLSQRALARHGGELTMSTTVLRAELTRVVNSPILLNRRLREVVLERLEREQLSLSEIAVRCGRVKRDRAGRASGETSWLARRIGLLPEAGQGKPTPWVHSDVLALIARSGLGVSPREVEVE